MVTLYGPNGNKRHFMTNKGYSVRYGMYHPVYKTYDRQKVWYYNMGLIETWDIVK